MVGTKGHVLVIPYPAQGHVKPLMQLSHRLANLGFKVTFVNTEFNHKRVISAANHPIDDSSVRLVSIPDGMGFEDDRKDLAKLCEAILTTMPKNLEKLIQEINIKALKGGDDGAMISCIIGDGYMGWVRNVGEKLGIKVAVAWPSSAAMFYLLQKVPKLIDDGFIDHDGFSAEKQIIQLSKYIPPFNTENFPWNSFGDSNSQKTMFKYLKRSTEDSLQAEWKLCNSIYLIEHGAFFLSPNLHSIGPLMSPISPTENSRAQFWKEDPSCLKWLDQQQPRSVIYAAFGSFTNFDQPQFEQLALGLQLTNKPFLWVVRPEITQNQLNKNYPDGQIEGRNGRIVGWVPQHKVLSHPAIACFVSHCGWNSTIEGISNGVPFLCWPYFGDQFLNKSYICDKWRVGLGLDKDEAGIVRKEELKGKIEQLIGDKGIKERCLKVKNVIRNSAEEGGQSSINFAKFIKWLEHGQ